MNLYHLGVISALVALALSSGLYLQSFASHKTRDILHRAAYGLLVLASLLMLGNTYNAYVYNLTHTTSSFVLVTCLGWITILAQLFFGVRLLGSVVAPVSTLILLLQFFFVSPHTTTLEEGPGILMKAHILSSVLGEAFAIIAFGIAVFYLMQQRAMKKKQLDRLQYTQVSIATLSQALIVTIWLGFALLTCGLILGAIYWQFYFDGDRAELLGKILWAILVWLWYLTTLISRNLFNLSAKKLAWMTIAGFCLLAFGLFGIYNWSSPLE